MTERDTHRLRQDTLESWKQIAAYLDRSERTVRRWEASEGLPVHRHEHGKQDTVFAYPPEIERWRTERSRGYVRPLPTSGLKRWRWAAGSSLAAAAIGLGSVAIQTAGLEGDDAVMVVGQPGLSQPDNLSFGEAQTAGYLTEHDAITRTIDRYILGGRAGNGDMMRAGFHPNATIAGYCQGVEYSGSIEHLFEWIDENGPAPNIEPRFARIEVFETIAVVNLEVEGWSGKLAGDAARISEIFTLLKRDGEWEITQKTFHWHET
jgi:putative lumazine-binding protein